MIPSLINDIKSQILTKKTSPPFLALFFEHQKGFLDAGFYSIVLKSGICEQFCFYLSNICTSDKICSYWLASSEKRSNCPGLGQMKTIHVLSYIGPILSNIGPQTAKTQNLSSWPNQIKRSLATQCFLQENSFYKTTEKFLTSFSQVKCREVLGPSDPGSSTPRPASSRRQTAPLRRWASAPSASSPLRDSAAPASVDEVYISRAGFATPCVHSVWRTRTINEVQLWDKSSFRKRTTAAKHLGFCSQTSLRSSRERALRFSGKDINWFGQNSTICQGFTTKFQGFSLFLSSVLSDFGICFQGFQRKAYFSRFLRTCGNPACRVAVIASTNATAKQRLAVQKRLIQLLLASKAFPRVLAQVLTNFPYSSLTESILVSTNWPSVKSNGILRCSGSLAFNSLILVVSVSSGIKHLLAVSVLDSRVTIRFRQGATTPLRCKIGWIFPGCSLEARRTVWNTKRRAPPLTRNCCKRVMPLWSEAIFEAYFTCNDKLHRTGWCTSGELSSCFVENTSHALRLNLDLRALLSISMRSKGQTLYPNFLRAPVLGLPQSPKSIVIKRLTSGVVISQTIGLVSQETVPCGGNLHIYCVQCRRDALNFSHHQTTPKGVFDMTSLLCRVALHCPNLFIIHRFID